jgi:hypothetical protein
LGTEMRTEFLLHVLVTEAKIYFSLSG